MFAINPNAANVIHISTLPTRIGDYHEGQFRAWHILRKVEHWLKAGVPAPVILELIHELQVAPPMRVIHLGDEDYRNWTGEHFPEDDDDQPQASPDV